jgi:hypothetical protein
MVKRLGVAVIVAALLVLPGLVNVEAAGPIVATATLTPGGEGLPGVFPRGTALLKAFPNIKKILVELTVEGLEPNSVHAWHIHIGTCQAQGPIVIHPGQLFPPRTLSNPVRRMEALKDLKANADGTAKVTVMLPDNPPTGGSILNNGVAYYLNVHTRSTLNGTGPGITCGNLSTNPQP